MRQSLDVKRMKMKTRLTSEMPDADDTHVHVSYFYPYYSRSAVLPLFDGRASPAPAPQTKKIFSATPALVGFIW